jgi:hypothetical protein
MFPHMRMLWTDQGLQWTLKEWIDRDSGLAVGSGTQAHAQDHRRRILAERQAT